MYLEQIQALTAHAEFLLENRKKCSKIAEIETLTKLIFDCFSKVREIRQEHQINSLLTYYKLRLVNGQFEFDYEEYACFCSRNKLELFSRADFEQFQADLLAGGQKKRGA